MTTARDDIAAIGWTLGETARRLGVPESTVRSWLHRGRVPEWAQQRLSDLADVHRQWDCLYGP